MYYHLTEALKRRFIEELRRYWSYHPRYRDIVDHIVGKYSQRERPQYGIILKTASANQVQLSADNFVGTVISYVQLAQVGDKPGIAVEWVREDGRAIQDATAANGGVPIFPSAPGVYYIDIVQRDENAPGFVADPQFDFYVDPLLDVRDEPLTRVDAFTYQATQPFLAGTTRVYEMPGGIPLVPGVNYTEDADTGRIVVVEPVPPGAYLIVDYRYAAPSTGPWAIQPMFSNVGAIPGVELMFGRRVEAGDQLAVVVYSQRQPTAEEYGGRWEISVDFDVVASDEYAQQEIVDASIQYLWGVARNRLSTEGIEITSVSMGGESEEIRDETGDDYFFNASFSVTTLTDWAIRVPLDATIRAVSMQSVARRDLTAAMSEEELAAADPATLQNLLLYRSLGLRHVQDPFYAVGNNYERIR